MSKWCQTQEECNPSVINQSILIENITESSAFLSWKEKPNTVLEYRFGGLDWHNYKSITNDAILYKLPACTTIECRVTPFNSQENNDAISTFTTLGCP